MFLPVVMLVLQGVCVWNLFALKDIHISCTHRKNSEAQKRYSFFFSSTTLAGAFGGLLAAGIGKRLLALFAFLKLQLGYATNHSHQF